MFTKILGDEKPFDELTKEEFGFALRQLDKNREKDPRKVEFGDIKRDPTTGRFKDEDLVRLLKDATDNVAGAFGAKSSPACMRIIDVIGIASARNDWNTCSLNEFRRFLNLKPFTKFEGEPQHFASLELSLTFSRSLHSLRRMELGPEDRQDRRAALRPSREP